MKNTLLEEFEQFFVEFQRIWNSCHTEKMIERLSPDIAVRWAQADGTVADWGYKEACLGWAEAFEAYCGHDPKWTFHPLKTAQASENEVIAMFWVTFEMDGVLKDVVKLFIQRFRKEESGWKLLREYCESLNPLLVNIK